MTTCEQQYCFISIDQTARIRNKAVADGAIIFRLHHSVSSRVARYTYGIQINESFNPSLADHLARADTSYEDLSGRMMVPNYFSSILQKVNFTSYMLCVY
jgi:hypothetical protein